MLALHRAARQIAPAVRVGWTREDRWWNLVDRHSHELRNGTIERVLAMSDVSNSAFIRFSASPRADANGTGWDPSERPSSFVR
jgi:hypothetical protein